MPTYQPCDDDVKGLLDEVLDRYHLDIADAGVTFSLLFAYAKEDADGNPVGPTLKHRGQPALAAIKINSLQDRVEGKADCTIRLDGDRWSEHSEETKLAILDHEVEHIVIIRTVTGAPETDDASRPKLKLREYDLYLGGFRSIVARHKRNAVESQQYTEANLVFAEQRYPWK